jgi:hypothetical protein
MAREGSAAIAMLNAWLVVWAPKVGVWLVTWTEREKVPEVVGVPLSTPAAESVRPGGSVPFATDQV